MKSDTCLEHDTYGTISSTIQKTSLFSHEDHDHRNNNMSKSKPTHPADETELATTRSGADETKLNEIEKILLTKPSAISTNIFVQDDHNDTIKKRSTMKKSFRRIAKKIARSTSSKGSLAGLKKISNASASQAYKNGDSMENMTMSSEISTMSSISNFSYDKLEEDAEREKMPPPILQRISEGAKSYCEIETTNGDASVQNKNRDGDLKKPSIQKLVSKGWAEKISFLKSTAEPNKEHGQKIESKTLQERKDYYDKSDEANSLVKTLQQERHDLLVTNEILAKKQVECEEKILEMTQTSTLLKECVLSLTTELKKFADQKRRENKKWDEERRHLKKYVLETETEVEGLRMELSNLAFYH